MLKYSKILTILGVFFIGTSALAQSAEDKWDKLPESLQEKILEKGDTDGDGVLSDTEKSALKEARQEKMAEKKAQRQERRAAFAAMTDEEKAAFKEEHAEQIANLQERKEQRRQRRQQRRGN